MSCMGLGSRFGARVWDRVVRGARGVRVMSGLVGAGSCGDGLFYHFFLCLGRVLWI